MIRAALLQLNVSDQPSDNLGTTIAYLRDAAKRGAKFVLTPEVTNCVSTSRAHQQTVLQPEAADETLRKIREVAAERDIWVLIGSLALKTDDPDGRFANRSFLIAPTGEIVARYDKIHMFDVDIGTGETYRESRGYRPGTQAAIAQTPFGTIGLTICYDVRFPHLYRVLATGGAQILTVPSAFSPTTGDAHWHMLLRARAIETGSYVLAPAQTGLHISQQHRPRETYGHSLVVDPWGGVVLDAGTDPGAYLFELDIECVEDARRRVPSLQHTRQFDTSG